MRLSSLLVATALLAAACGTNVVNPVTGKTERSVMDEASEIAEGKKAHDEVMKEFGGPLANPTLQAYVNELGQRLAKQSHRAHLQWTFTVLDSADVNAFALPGGYVYVTRGIMAYLDSEADLAGVIGHEIGHVTARHGAQRATKQQRAGAGVMAATVLGVLVEAVTGVQGAAQAANQVSTGIAAGSIASYSREQELQADQLGAEYLSRVGFSAKHMVDVIGVLKDQERFAADTARAAGRKVPEGGNWLASHPSNDERLQAITRIAQGYGGSAREEGQQRYLRAIDGITYGESREQGVVRRQNFFHEPLGLVLTAPTGWSFDNNPEMLRIINAAGDAGLLMKLVPPAAGKTHEEILRNAFKASQGRTERQPIGGFESTYFVGQRTLEQNQTQPLEVTLVNGPGGRTYAFIHAARDAATLERNRALLREATASFRSFAPSDRAAAKPWTLRSVALPAGGFAELARRSPLGAQAEPQLKLLNGVYGGGTIAPGRPVKIVE
ncbi:MAG: M48 family metalloprotease [Burkholderiaceae bacterium]